MALGSVVADGLVCLESECDVGMGSEFLDIVVVEDQVQVPVAGLGTELQLEVAGILDVLDERDVSPAMPGSATRHTVVTGVVDNLGKPNLQKLPDHMDEHNLQRAIWTNPTC
jgi:hypothetical protein